MAADTTKKHFIRIRGANVNNLKNLSVDIPRDKFVVFTGLSGSGKSSLAFDTIYAKGQRRYMESLSSYARQFLGQMEKPDVESIEGLPPAISIDQTVYHNLYIMLDILVQTDLLGKLIQVSVNLHTYIFASLCLLQKLCMSSLAPPHNRLTVAG